MSDKGKSRSAAILVLLLLAVGLGAVVVTTVLGATWRLSERRSSDVDGDASLNAIALPGSDQNLLRIDPEGLREALEKKTEITLAEPEVAEEVVEEATEAKPVVIGVEWVYVANTFAMNNSYGIFMDSRDGKRYQMRVGDPLGDTLLTALAPTAATITKGELFRVLPLVDPASIELSRGGAGSDEEAALMMAAYMEKYGNKAREDYANYVPRPNENMPPGEAPSAEDEARAREQYMKDYAEKFKEQSGNWSPQDGFQNPNQYDPAFFPSRREQMDEYVKERLPEGIPKEAETIKPGDYVKDEHGTRFIRVNPRRKKG